MKRTSFRIFALKQGGWAKTVRVIERQFGITVNEATIRDWAKKERIAITKAGFLVDVVIPEYSLIKPRRIAKGKK